MASTRRDDLFDLLRGRGVRKSVAKAVAGVERKGGKTGRRSEKIARDVIADLEAAADDIRDRLTGGKGRKRREAAQKAARTRKRQAAKRSAAARKAAKTRAAKS